MDKNAIRTEDQRLERSRLIESNRIKRAQEKFKEEKALIPQIPDTQLLVDIFF